MNSQDEDTLLQEFEKMPKHHLSDFAKYRMLSEIKNQKTQSKPHSRFPRWIGSTATGVAAVFIVAIGGYAVMNHQTKSTVTAHKQPPSSKLSIPSSIQTVYMVKGKASQSRWQTNDISAVNKHVIGWLKQSSPYGEELVEEPSEAQVQMHFTTSAGQQVAVYPMSSLKNVIVYQVGSHKYYLKSPALYDWLQSGKWQTVFVDPVDRSYTAVGNLRLDSALSSMKNQYGQPTTTTSVHGNGAPEWIYKKQGITVYGDPIWHIAVTAPFQGSLTNGVHVGSPAGAVAKAYPNLTPHTFPDGTWYTPSSPDNKYQTTIAIQNGVVTSITIEKNLGLATPPKW